MTTTFAFITAASTTRRSWARPVAAVGLALAAAMSAACASVQPVPGGGDAVVRRPPRMLDEAALAPDAVQFTDDAPFAYFDGSTGRRLSFDDVLARAKDARAIVVGEQHDQATHHDLQRRVVAALAADGPTVVGLEMLPWTAQRALDQFNSGELDADAFAEAADWQKAWGFTFDLYRPILVDGRTAGARFVALNAPRELVRAVRTKGIQGLSAEERRVLPELDLTDPEHRAWFKGIFGSGRHPMDDADVESFYVAQVVWDETMAAGATKALDDGAKRVVVLAGVGHVARGRGVPQRIERRLPKVRVLTIVPLGDISSDNADMRLREAIVDGEGDVLVVPRFEEELAL